MKQMVYVVLDGGEVVGVYDEYSEAEAVASPMATITPVIVGKTDVTRVGCNTPDEVIMAMEHELVAPPCGDEDEDDLEEEEEEEDEDEDMDSIIYDVEGRPGICADDARLLIECVTKVMEAKYPWLSEDKLYELIQRETLAIADKYGIERVDCSEDEDEDE